MAAAEPHRPETFKLSTDPLFFEKGCDIIGLYLNPPERAVVPCVDEKSQTHALDRTQPLMPMRPSQVGRHTHDYRRPGTLSLLSLSKDRRPRHCSRQGDPALLSPHHAVEFRKFPRHMPAPADTIDNRRGIDTLTGGPQKLDC
jgi:hypothetical protein